MEILKKIAYLISFFLLFLFLLFLFLEKYNYENFENFYADLENLSKEERFGQLNGHNIIFSHEIYKFRNLQFENKLSVRNVESAIQNLESGKFEAYLTHVDSLKIVNENYFGSYKIIGKNSLQKNYGFIVSTNCLFSLKNKNANSFYRFAFWIKQILRGNLGKLKNANYDIKNDVLKALPITLILTILSLFYLIVFSLFFAFFLNSKPLKYLRKFIELLLYLLSSIPEFILAFVVLIVFLYTFKFLKGHDTYFMFFQDNMKFTFSNLILMLKYFSFPALIISFSNSNLMTLISYLRKQLSELDKQQHIIFFKANGMKFMYIKYFIMMKELIVTIIAYISLKIPLIIGSSVIVDKIFDMNGLGNMVYEFFKTRDSGGILILFALIYFISIFIDFTVFIANYYLSPVKRKMAI